MQIAISAAAAARRAPTRRRRLKEADMVVSHPLFRAPKCACERPARGDFAPTGRISKRRNRLHEKSCGAVVPTATYDQSLTAATRRPGRKSEKVKPKAAFLRHSNSSSYFLSGKSLRPKSRQDATARSAPTYTTAASPCGSLADDGSAFGLAPPDLRPLTADHFSPVQHFADLASKVDLGERFLQEGGSCLDHFV